MSKTLDLTNDEREHRESDAIINLRVVAAHVVARLIEQGWDLPPDIVEKMAFEAREAVIQIMIDVANRERT